MELSLQYFNLEVSRVSYLYFTKEGMLYQVSIYDMNLDSILA